MSWKPEVTVVNKVEKHPNADLLDVITIYSDIIVIAKINQFKVGDLVSYLPLDTYPGNHKDFEFLGKDKNKRIRAKRLRGIFSTGLIVRAPEGFADGDSIIEHYNLKRYIASFERSEYGSDGIKSPGHVGNNISNPKEFEIPYYDIENARKYSNLFEKGESIVLTEKIHGENFSMIYFNDKMYVKSRNFYKEKTNESRWWEVPIRENYEDRIKKYPGYVFMGECYGNVSGFRYDCKIENNIVQRKFRCFDIYDVKEKKYLHYNEIQRICSELNIETVPQLYIGGWNSLNDLKKFAEDSSSLNHDNIKEGFVIRSLDRAKFKNNDRAVLKYVSEKYLESKHA